MVVCGPPFARGAFVTCLYRRDRENILRSQREVANAEKGVKFAWLTTPQICRPKWRRGRRDRSTYALGPRINRGGVRPCPEEKTRLKADLVLKALGFEAEDLPNLFQQPDCPSPMGTIKAAPITGATEMAAFLPQEIL